MKNKNLQREISWLLKEKYNGQLIDRAKKDITLLKKGHPLDYVIGFTEFLGCKIDLFYKPLIPRVETEFWVKKVLLILQNKSLGKLRVLDIFAGSGCIGVAILKNTNALLCDIAEKDGKLVKQIRKNLKLNKIDKKRGKVIKSDIFLNIKRKYNYILANSPYIPIKNKSKVQKSTLKYEPKKALFGGQDGLFFIKRFLKQAKNYLTEKGIIYMEFDSLQKKKIEKLLKNFNYSSWQFHKDQFDKWRWVEIQK
jgi:release factor glutamine methyltransferase